MSLSEFWELTPFEFEILVDAYIERTKFEQEEKITLAYMTAFWTAQWFSKRKPLKLDKILKKEKKTMTDAEMLRQIESLNNLFGGEVK